MDDIYLGKYIYMDVSSIENIETAFEFTKWIYGRDLSTQIELLLIV